MAMNGGSRKDECPVSSESYVECPQWLVRSILAHLSTPLPARSSHTRTCHMGDNMGPQPEGQAGL